jgi:hypothetical protein
MADHLRVGGILFKRRDESSAPTHDILLDVFDGRVAAHPDPNLDAQEQ